MQLNPKPPSLARSRLRDRVRRGPGAWPLLTVLLALLAVAAHMPTAQAWHQAAATIDVAEERRCDAGRARPAQAQQEPEAGDAEEEEPDCE